MLPVQYVFHFSNKMYQKSLQKRLREFKQAEDHYAIYRYNCAESDLETISKEVAAVYPLINHLYRFKPQEKIQFAVYARKADLQNIMHLDTENTPMGIYWLGQIHLLAPAAWIVGAEEERNCAFRLLGPVAHEYTHYVIDYQTRGNYPRWLSEGLAQYTEQALAKMPPFSSECLLREDYYTLDELEYCFDFLRDQPLAYLESLLAGEILIEQYSFGYVRKILQELKTGKGLEEILYCEKLNYPTLNLLLREKLAQLRKNFAQSLVET